MPTSIPAILRGHLIRRFGGDWPSDAALNERAKKYGTGFKRTWD